MKFNFGFKLYFSYFFVSILREERESGWVLMVERESPSWNRFQPRKPSDFGFNMFLFVSKVYIRCFFSFKLAWNGESEPENNFSFRLIVGFEDNFLVVRGYKYILHGV